MAIIGILLIVAGALIFVLSIASASDTLELPSSVEHGRLR
jgi:hypothetical protein